MGAHDGPANTLAFSLLLFQFGVLNTSSAVSISFKYKTQKLALLLPRTDSLVSLRDSVSYQVTIRPYRKVINLLSGQFIILSRFDLIAENLIGVSYVQVERRIEAPHPVVSHCIGANQRLLVPMERVLGALLVSGQEMGGQACVVVIL